MRLTRAVVLPGWDELLSREWADWVLHSGGQEPAQKWLPLSAYRGQVYTTSDPDEARAMAELAGGVDCTASPTEWFTRPIY